MLRLFLVLLSIPIAVSIALIISLPVSVEVQLVMGAVLLTLMWLLKPIGGRTATAIFLALGGIIIGRYVYWRLTSTIPDISVPWDFLPAILLVAAELFCIAMFLLAALIVADPYNRPRKKLKNMADAPSVDVFIPSYNEDPELVAVTMAAAKNMTYPAEKLNVYLLDDGATDQKLFADDPKIAHAAAARRQRFIELCAKLGVRYLARERNISAKAGNLNYGLAHSKGELVVVFDADHAPSKEFLLETVDYFSEKRLFLVQTPHFFLNPDPVQRNMRSNDYMPAENDMFYGLIQKGLDKWNAAFFCGSAAVLRRAALAEVGGFSGISITEDCETALELHSRGWESAYVDRPMISGLQPDTLASFIGQRSRWCRGMLQIMILKNPLFKRGLNLMQRLCYLSSCLFWLFPFSRMMFLIAPLLFIFFGMQIYIATPQEFIAYTLVYFLATLSIQSALYGRFRWPWISELYEYIQSLYLFPAIMAVIARPRAPKFNVTAKGETLDKDQLSVVAGPFIAVFLVLLAATGVLIWRFDADAGSRTLLIVIGVWQVLNLIIAAAALGAVCERKELRRSPRVTTRRQGTLQVAHSLVDVVIEDANSHGVKVRLVDADAVLPTGDQIGTLRFPSNGAEAINITVKIVSEQHGGEKTLGLAFTEQAEARPMAVGSLVHADLTIPWQIHRAKLVRSSVFVSTMRIIFWGFVYGVRAPLLALSQLTSRPRQVEKPAEENTQPVALAPAE